MKKIVLLVSLFASSTFLFPFASFAGESCAKVCASNACKESCNGGKSTDCHCQSGEAATCECADDHEHGE